MSKQVLSVEQMQHLQELGLDINNASMCWIKDTEGNRHVSVHDEYCHEASFMSPVPAYPLQDVLDKLPEEIKYKRKDYHIEIWIREGEWSIGYLHFAVDDVLYAHHEQDKEILNAAYRMLCWCIKEGYVQKNLS